MLGTAGDAILFLFFILDCSPLVDGDEEDDALLRRLAQLDAILLLFGSLIARQWRRGG